MNINELITYIVSKIVDHPDEIEIEETQIGENAFQYTISSNKEDIGKIIGKGGKIIQAIRNVVKIPAIKENKQIRIEVA